MDKDTPIVKISYNQKITTEDLEYYQKHFGDRLLEEGERHVVVMFRSGMDYLAFQVATGQIRMTQVVTGVDIRDIEATFTMEIIPPSERV